MDKNTITKLGNTIIAIQNEAVKQTLLVYKPEVERIIRTKDRNIDTIEHTLDALGETAFNDEVLLLLKKLCRYYYDTDPAATVEHINWYREMWDSFEEI